MMETLVTQTIIFLAAASVFSAIGIGVRRASITESVGAYRVMVGVLFAMVLFPTVQVAAIMLAPNWFRLPAPSRDLHPVINVAEPAAFSFADESKRKVAPPLATGAPSSTMQATPLVGSSGSAWVLVMAYVAGILVLAARQIRSIRGVRTVLRHAKPVCDDHVLRIWRGIAGVDRRAVGVRLLECDGLPSPACLGVFRPTVLIPENVLADTDEAGLNCALRHEWIHVRRMDVAVMHLQRMVVTLLWFHPLVWRLSRWIDVYRELSCDVLVVRETRNPKSYALALLDFCRRVTPFEGEPQSNRGYPAVAVANLAFVRAAPVVPVKRRIEMIAQTDATKRSGFALKASVASAVLVTLAGAAVAAAFAPRDRVQPKTSPHSSNDAATRTLDLSRPGDPVTVRSGLEWGAFTVRPHDQASVTIHVVKKTETGAVEDESVFDTIDFYEEKPNQFVIEIEDVEEGEHVGYSISIFTPVSSSVTLAMSRGGEISVSGLDGDFTLSSTNGSVSLMEVSGSATVSAQNGSIDAEFVSLNENPIAMSVQNGSVDLTVPADIDAQVSMATQHGAVYSDFELQNIVPSHNDDFDGREGSKQWTSASDGAMNGLVGDGNGTISLATQHGAAYLRMSEGGKKHPNHAY